MNPKEFTLKLEDRLEGAIGERGKFTGYLPNGKKGATYQYQHINFEDHFTGFEYYGLSPVKIIQNGKIFNYATYMILGVVLLFSLIFVNF